MRIKLKIPSEDAVDRMKKLIEEGEYSYNYICFIESGVLHYDEYDYSKVDYDWPRRALKEIECIFDEDYPTSAINHILLGIQTDELAKANSGPVEEYSKNDFAVLKQTMEKLMPALQEINNYLLSNIHDDNFATNKVNGIAIDLNSKTLKYDGGEKSYKTGKPWMIIQRCASNSEGMMDIRVFLESDWSKLDMTVLEAKINGINNRINAYWKKKKGVRIISKVGQYVILKPIKVDSKKQSKM